MDVILFVAALLAIAIFWFYAKAKRANELNAWLEAKGVRLDHNYSNVLGIDQRSGKVFFYTDAAYLFDKGQIRSVERSSIHETRHNIYGMGFHKDKECRLVIHTSSVDKPLHVIGFEKKDEMDVWYSRLGAFCGLS